MPQIAAQFPLAVDVQVHAGQSSISVHAITVLPHGIRHAAQAISGHAPQPPGVAGPNPSIVHMDHESSFRSECSCDLFENPTTMRATLDHADRAVQASRQMQGSIPEKIELRHVAVNQDHRSGLFRVLARVFRGSAREHRATEVDSDGSPSAFDERQQRSTGTAPQIHGDRNFIAASGRDLICDLEDPLPVQLEKGMSFVKRIVLAGNVGLRDIVPGPFGNARRKLPTRT